MSLVKFVNCALRRPRRNAELFRLKIPPDLWEAMEGWSVRVLHHSAGELAGGNQVCM